MKTQFPSSRRRPTPSGNTGIYWGLRLNGSFYQTYYASNANDGPWCISDAHPNNLDLVIAHAGKSPSSLQWGNSGTISSNQFPKTIADLARTAGLFSQYDLSASKTEIDGIIAKNVTYLNYIRSIAANMFSHGFPILFRPFWEMNGNWTTQTTSWFWQDFQGTTAAEYKTLWQNVWQEFANVHDGFAAGSTSGTSTGNVSFFWCPNVWSSTDNAATNERSTGINHPSIYWPGSTYVDWIGFDGYNQTNVSPSTLFDTTYNIVTGLGPGLPVSIGETGCQTPATYSGGKSQWITDLFAWGKSKSQLKHINWFNQIDGSKYWPFELGNASITTKDAEAEAAFKAALTDSTFKANVASSFASGSKLPIP